MSVSTMTKKYLLFLIRYKICNFQLKVAGHFYSLFEFFPSWSNFSSRLSFLNREKKKVRVLLLGIIRKHRWKLILKSTRSSTPNNSSNIITLFLPPSSVQLASIKLARKTHREKSLKYFVKIQSYHIQNLNMIALTMPKAI